MKDRIKKMFTSSNIKMKTLNTKCTEVQNMKLVWCGVIISLNYGTLGLTWDFLIWHIFFSYSKFDILKICFDVFIFHIRCFHDLNKYIFLLFDVFEDYFEHLQYIKWNINIEFWATSDAIRDACAPCVYSFIFSNSKYFSYCTI